MPAAEEHHIVIETIPDGFNSGRRYVLRVLPGYAEVPACDYVPNRLSFTLGINARRTRETGRQGDGKQGGRKAGGQGGFTLER